MRIVVVWSFAVILWFTVTLAYLITLPIAFSFGSAIETQVAGSPALTPFRIIEFVVIVWGPIWDIFILLWAIMESQRQDVGSMRYG